MKKTSLSLRFKRSHVTATFKMKQDFLFVSVYEKMSVKLPKMNDGRGRKHAGHCEITNAFRVVATGVKCHLRAERLMLTVEMMNLQFFQQHAHKSTDSKHTHTHTLHVKEITMSSFP